MRHPAVLPIVLALAACGGEPAPVAAPAAPSSPAPSPSPSPAAPPPPAPPAERPWLDVRGTSIVGFGMLRVVPEPGRRARVTIRHRETPDGYSTRGDLQTFVLPADAFAATDRAYADSFLAFARTADAARVDASGSLRVETSFDAGPDERTVLVAYGPWTAPDAGRPAGDVPVFSTEVAVEGGAAEWIESEAGELITTNWTGRPGVARGGPCRDPVEGGDLWIEVRPMIVYDGRIVRAAGEPPLGDPAAVRPAALLAEAARLASAGRAAAAADLSDRAADLAAHEARADGRLVLTPALAEKFRRVPIRWR